METILISRYIHHPTSFHPSFNIGRIRALSGKLIIVLLSFTVVPSDSGFSWKWLFLASA